MSMCFKEIRFPIRNLFLVTLLFFSGLSAKSQNAVIPARADSVSKSGMVFLSEEPTYCRLLQVGSDGSRKILAAGDEETISYDNKEQKARENRNDRSSAASTHYGFRAKGQTNVNVLLFSFIEAEKALEKAESTLFSLIEYGGELYLLPKGSRRLLLYDAYNRWLLVPDSVEETVDISGSCAPISLAVNSRKQLNINMGGKVLRERVIPVFPLEIGDVAEINLSIPLINEIVNKDFTSKARRDDYYHFDEYGELDKFRYTYNDGVILDYLKDTATYSLTDGTMMAFEKHISSEEYESLVSKVSTFPGINRFIKYPEIFKIFIERDLLKYVFPNGAKISRCTPEGDYFIPWTGSDPKGSILGGVTSLNGNYAFQADKGNSIIYFEVPYKKIVFEDYEYENNGDGHTDRYVIRYPDGSFFEGSEVSFIIDDNGKTPPALCSKEVVSLINKLLPSKEPAIILYGVTPVKGRFYKPDGTLYRVMESPSIYYDANSDGIVTEVYVDGKPMPSGFSRDKKINEYNGNLKREQDELKAREESYRQYLAEKAKEEAEREKNLQSLRAKFGPAFDQLLKGKVTKGADFNMFYYVSNTDVELEYDEGDYKRYGVRLGRKDLTVWTLNGKIESVRYW